MQRKASKYFRPLWMSQHPLQLFFHCPKHYLKMEHIMNKLDKAFGWAFHDFFKEQSHLQMVKNIVNVHKDKSITYFFLKWLCKRFLKHARSLSKVWRFQFYLSTFVMCLTLASTPNVFVRTNFLSWRHFSFFVKNGSFL